MRIRTPLVPTAVGGLTRHPRAVRTKRVRWALAIVAADGIIGWTVRQTWFQRRAGLATITATTAAGSGGYAMRDVDAGEGLAVAVAAVPALLDPFLEPNSAAASPTGS